MTIFLKRQPSHSHRIYTVKNTQWLLQDGVIETNKKETECVTTGCAAEI